MIDIIEPALNQADLLKEFYRNAYGRDDYPLLDNRFLHWWLHENPFYKGKGFSCKAAYDTEKKKIVGHFAYVPVMVWTHGKNYSGAWTGNQFVREEYRGQGIARKLVESIMREHEIVLDVGANALAEAVLAKRGWRHFGPLCRFVGVLDPARAEKLAGDQAVLEESRIKIPDEAGDSSVAVREVKGFSETHDAFWSEFRKNIPSATDRSSEYLNWRYRDHPVFHYRILEARRGATGIGFAVWRKEEAAGEWLAVLRLVDFLADSDAELPLLKTICEIATQEKAVLIDFFCASKRYGNACKKFGFSEPPVAEEIARLFSPIIPKSGPISFNGRDCKNQFDSDRFFDQEQWYVTTGDGDQDRPNSITRNK